MFLLFCCLSWRRLQSTDALKWIQCKRINKIYKTNNNTLLHLYLCFSSFFLFLSIRGQLGGCLLTQLYYSNAVNDDLGIATTVRGWTERALVSSICFDFSFVGCEGTAWSSVAREQAQCKSGVVRPHACFFDVAIATTKTTTMMTTTTVTTTTTTIT